MTKKNIIGIGILIIVFLIGIFIFWSRRISHDEQVFCAQDAMLCPDGSYVGRTGPNCEFVCPLIPPNSSGDDQEEIVTVRFGERTDIGQFDITVINVLEDSRCPEGTVCIWAGTVRVRVMIASNLGEREQTMVLREPISREDSIMTLIDVMPHPVHGVLVPHDEYVFRFRIQKL